MTESEPLTADKMADAQNVLASMGISGADFAAGIAAGTPILAAAAKAAFTSVDASVQPCTHPDGCTHPVTHQTQRPATPEEAAAHWDGLEQHIRSHGNPDYVQNRDGIPAIAELRCDDPQHADPLYLEALKSGQEATAA